MSTGRQPSTVLPTGLCRLGGDPREFAEYPALREELNRLNHPARPDMAWCEVERLSLVLLQRNGAELQTLACLTLARSYRFGVAGAIEGVVLLDNLLRVHGTRAWPTASEQRLETLAWLFSQLHMQLRAVQWTVSELAAVAELERALGHLHERLDRQLQRPVLQLHSLRQLLRSVSERVPHEGRSFSVQSSGKALVFAETGVSRRRWLWGALAAALVGALWWGRTLLGVPGQPLELAWPGSAVTVATAEHLASLAIFGPGSAELGEESTKALIGVLAGIQATPGWLLEITGHSDGTGDDEANRRLSRARAAAVRDWLQRVSGIAEHCFVIQGVGASQPMVSNETAAGRMANRRVEIRRVPAEGACVNLRP
jgi:type VI secretion system protein VasL